MKNQKVKFHLVEILGLNFVIRLSETDYKKEFCEQKAHYQQTLRKIRMGRAVDVPLLIEGRSLRFIGTKNDSPEKPDDDLVLLRGHQAHEENSGQEKDENTLRVCFSKRVQRLLPVLSEPWTFLGLDAGQFRQTDQVRANLILKCPVIGANLVKDRYFVEGKFDESTLDKADDIIIEGLIQRFEYTHELAWNVMKDFIMGRGNTNIYGSQGCDT